MLQHLDLKYLAAYNFMPFGPKGIVLDLKQLSNIVSVRGINLDNKAPDDDDTESSNGVGKSTIPEIIAWVIFGKTIKNHKKIKIDDVINNKIGKQCRGEVRWDKYRVVRGRKPKILDIWESETGDWDNAKKLSTDNDKTQEIIEEKFGLSYEAFLTICIFTDDNRNCFLECDGPTKREIVENILNLFVYRKKCDNVKKVIKQLTDGLKLKVKEYELITNNKKNADFRLEQSLNNEASWLNGKKKELGVLIGQIKSKKDLLASTDVGSELVKYQEAQARLVELGRLSTELETINAEDKNLLEGVKSDFEKSKEEVKIFIADFNDLKAKIKNLRASIESKEKDIADVLTHDGTKCSKCKKGICKDDPEIEEFIFSTRQEIDVIKNDLIEPENKVKEFQDKSGNFKVLQDELKLNISNLETKIRNSEGILTNYRNELLVCSRVREPKLNDHVMVIEQEINDLKRAYNDKKRESEGDSPHKGIITSIQQEISDLSISCEEKNKEVTDIENLLPYYEYWLKAFGDNGIRKWIIDGVIAPLNENIAYWMQYLIDNKIELTFNNQLEETIKRIPYDGDEFVYHTMSAGERRRINLAISQAFAHLIMVNSGKVPSLVFLDEVATNIDQIGVQGIYRMICELSKEKQVFVTTHDQGLLELLNNNNTLWLKKENDITTLVETS